VTEPIQPYDDVIARLEKQLARQKEKLEKKFSPWNKVQYTRIKSMLDHWKKEREEELKIRERDANNSEQPIH
jgi:hypothetical protein